MSVKSKKGKVSFILYEDQKIPRYLSLNRGIFNFLIHSPPAVIIISLAVAFGSLFYAKNIEKIIRSSEPEIIRELKEEKALLAEKNKEVISENNILTERLSKGMESTPFSALNLFTNTAGQKDLTNPSNIQIQDLDVQSSASTTFLRFNIVNISQGNKKLSGFIHVLATNGNIFFKYPVNNNEVEEFQIRYAKGESFATSRFRPVEATFKNVFRKSTIFKIIIFNRTGDIIHQQQFKHVPN